MKDLKGLSEDDLIDVLLQNIQIVEGILNQMERRLRRMEGYYLPDDEPEPELKVNKKKRAD